MVMVLGNRAKAGVGDKVILSDAAQSKHGVKNGVVKSVRRGGRLIYCVSVGRRGKVVELFSNEFDTK